MVEPSLLTLSVCANLVPMEKMGKISNQPTPTSYKIQCIPKTTDNIITTCILSNSSIYRTMHTTLVKKYINHICWIPYVCILHEIHENSPLPLPVILYLYIISTFSAIKMSVEDFEVEVNKCYNNDESKLVDGYAPFCKHLFVPNFAGMLRTTIAITEDNQHMLRSAYEARTEKELPVLNRWFPAELVIFIYCERKKEGNRLKNIARDCLCLDSLSLFMVSDKI
jgi:hypothetical protein